MLPLLILLAPQFECPLCAARSDVWLHARSRPRPWQSCSGHSVCLIFSLAPHPKPRAFLAPRGPEGSSCRLKAASHFRAGTLSRYQISIPFFLLFGPERHRLPSVLSAGYFCGEWTLWRRVWLLWEEILLALSFPALRLPLDLCPRLHPRMWIGRGCN